MPHPVNPPRAPAGARGVPGAPRRRRRAELAARGRHRRWPAGASLFLEGDRSGTVVVIVSGRVKVFSITEQGEEVLLAVRGPGALLGELSAVDGAPRGASVAALEPVVALVVPAADFAAFLSGHPGAAAVLLRLVVSRLRDADRKRVEFGAHDIAARVAGRLVELADRFGEPDATGVRIAVPCRRTSSPAGSGRPARPWPRRCACCATAAW
jgi:CRP-like cAMP-binding protein